jgi:hypothetical protein
MAWKFIAYLWHILSRAKALLDRFIALFRDDNRPCSCSSDTSVPRESSSTGRGMARRRICKHQRWKAFRACSIHVLPLAFTAFVLFLNFSTTYYENVGLPGQSLRLNALQFAAKLHEILIATSLSLVGVNHIQYELLVGKGLPLSNVLAGFSITNLTAMFSSRPWEKKRFTKSSRTRRIRSIALLFLLVVMCAIAGPSSAVLVLPTIGWWKFGFVSAEGYYAWDPSEIRFFINATESILWPLSITSKSFLAPDCIFTNSTVLDSCPAGGLAALKFSGIQFFQEGLPICT